MIYLKDEIPRHFFYGLSYQPGPFQPFRMDLEKNQAAESYMPASDCRIVGATGDLLWIRILPRDRLAF
jgi:hypothetical protein